MDSTSTRPHLSKAVVIMGPTGSGKSKLSVHLASTFFKCSEIINSDKIQLYKGLDITTNKITLHEQHGVTHHLLGAIDSSYLVSPFEFRSLASSYVSDIISRRKLPFIVGGSNSLIYALLTKKFNPKTDVFNGSKPDPVSSELRYNCCFLYIDVSLPVLNQYLSKRVDEMLDSGMLEELQEFYDSGKCNSVNPNGLGQAIGIPELDNYLRRTKNTNSEDDVAKKMYEEAVKAIKDNTCELAKRQVNKIQRLRDGGWELHRIDGTEALRAALGWSKVRVEDVWEKQVVETSVKIVKQFLQE
ncbi:adenylate isopentenyltransferase [Apium graveolens]|uniref:adenylate isopentenyltransferase n=1 Tax=Apium graveolens TaxID=4045 RepID=UPI003D7A4873